MEKEQLIGIGIEYGLKTKLANVNNKKELLPIIYDAKELYINSNGYTELFRPILYPISNVSEKIYYNNKSFIPNNLIEKMFGKILTFSWIGGKLITPISLEEFNIVLKLIEWHFDILGLIENREAIDVNTLEINPYK